MTLVLDAGALVAFENGNRVVQAFLERARADGIDVRTTTGVVAPVWRGGPRQARLALLLKGVLEVDLSPGRARGVGLLLGTAGLCDVVDGSVVEAASDGDEILTSDPDDITAVARASGCNVIVTRV